MQFASSGTPDEVQAYVVSVIARYGGRVTATSGAVTAAEFTKKFSWMKFLLLLVLLGIGFIYLIAWFVTKDQSLTVTYRQADGVVYGSMQATGKRAEQAAKVIQRAFAA